MRVVWRCRGEGGYGSMEVRVQGSHTRWMEAEGKEEEKGGGEG